MKQSPSIRGFTLTELLVVLAIMAVLSALLLPALSRAASKAQGTRCMNNLKQMSMAWVSYAHDNRDYLVMNWGDQARTNWESWARGSLCLDRDNPDWFPISESTNILLLLDSPLAAHGAKLGLWRCPSDKSMRRQADGQRYPRSRSLTMNCWLASNVPALPGGFASRRSRIIMRSTGIVKPSPANCFVFQDTREDAFYCSVFIAPFTGMDAFVTFPGSYHNGAGNFSFADGHVEPKRWRDARTCPPIQDHWLLPFPSWGSWYGSSCPGNPDVHWLQDHAFPQND